MSNRQERINRKNERRRRRLLSDVKDMLSTAHGAGEYSVALVDFGHALMVCMRVSAPAHQAQRVFALHLRSRGRVACKRVSAPSVVGAAVAKLNGAAARWADSLSAEG